MFGLDLGAVALVLPYQFIMLYGVGSLALRWAGGQHQRGREQLFLVLGVCVPVAVWLLSFFYPPASWLTAVSLGALAAVGGRDGRRLERTGARELDEALADAERLIAEDEGNAAAHLAKAETLEKRGEAARAPASYRRTHALCRRTLTDYALEEIEERLGAAKERGRPARCWEPMPALELFMLAAAVSYLPYSLAMGVNLTGVTAYLLWLRVTESKIPRKAE